jgi:N-acetyl-anhydromuramyl-L-alanine amidase AmpD
MRGWRLPVVVLYALVYASACTMLSTALPHEDGPAYVVRPLGDRDPIAATPPRAAPPARSATQVRFPYAPQPEWLPTQTNYDVGRDGASIEYVVIHYTDISYERTLRAFNIRAADVSSHYVVRGDGHIAQIVGEADTAWHSGNYWFNISSIGIELELDRITNPVFTAEEYYAAAALVCGIAGRYGIPLDRAHIIGHNEVPGSTHTDPGPTWGWPHFMWLVSLCAPPTAETVHASFVSESAFPEIRANEKASISVVLQNTGSTAWRKGTSQEARLAIPNNDPNFAFLGDGWPTPDRPAAQAEEIVPPGSTATFTFAVKGSRPGSYVVPLRGVVDGGAWMDDLGMYTVVTVIPKHSGS